MKSSKLLLFLYALLVVGLPLAGLGYALLGSVGVVGPLAGGFTGRYWRALGQDTGLLGAALFSAWVAAVSLGLAVGVALALVLGAQRTLRRWPFPALLYVPLLMPPLVLGFYLFELLSGAGWLSRVSFQLGLTGSPEAFPSWCRMGPASASSGRTCCWGFRFSRCSSRPSTRKAASTTTASSPKPWARRRDSFGGGVAAPVLLRRAAPTLLLSGIATLGAYDLPLLLGRPYPQMLSVYIATRLQRFDLRELPNAYLAGFLVAAGLLGLILVLIRLTKSEIGRT